MFANPHRESEIFKSEVQPRISRMRDRLLQHFRGHIPVQPSKMHPNEIVCMDDLHVTAHALFVLNEIEKDTGSDGMVRARAYLGERAASHAFHQIQCLEYLLMGGLKLYSLSEIENSIAKQNASRPVL